MLEVYRMKNMFELPDAYKLDVNVDLKDFIPKDLKPNDKKRIKDAVKYVKLEYQIAGEEIPSVNNEEYRCQVNFEITNEYIDKIIREKIGFEACTELSNEMDENELILFFTWNSAGGYVACTTEQIIWADKTSGGNVSNINRFYYDEIVKIETVQEASNLASSSSATSLTGFLVDMAVSTVADAAVDSFMKDVCDIKLLVQGSYKTMSGMVKLEADRIIAIYNGFKKSIRAEEKELKKQSASPQVVVQQQSQPDVLEQIKKLASLKEAGILSEEEFTSKKTELLSKL